MNVVQSRLQKITFGFFIAALSICSLVYWVHTYREYEASGRWGNDPVSGWNERLVALENDLPKQGIVGYLSEADIPWFTVNLIDENTEYALTQYHLSPLIIDRGKDHPYVIANITGLELDYPLAEYFGLVPVKSYGFGIYLFTQEQP